MVDFATLDTFDLFRRALAPQPFQPVWGASLGVSLVCGEGHRLIHVAVGPAQDQLGRYIVNATTYGSISRKTEVGNRNPADGMPETITPCRLCPSLSALREGLGLGLLGVELKVVRAVGRPSGGPSTLTGNRCQLATGEPA